MSSNRMRQPAARRPAGAQPYDGSVTVERAASDCVLLSWP